MCGINGFNFKSRELILKMNQLTRHRGPDQTDFWLGENISLGHNRLSIIDLSSRGNQPMWDAQKQVVIVFNGEIYNFKELRKELEKKYEFRSDSDTEVVIYSYLEYGGDCVKKFNGIFAFAIWDMRTQELFLARDRVGIKPFYYYYDKQQFIFSSEIKGILAHNIPREVDREAFNLYFQLLYVPEPLTMFSVIKKLPAASYATLRKNGELEIKKYWEISDFSSLTSFEDAKIQINNLFRDSVRQQLVSDRPVGVYLSGGLDSTAILGAVKEFHNGKIKTFSVGFKESQDPEKFNADFFLARQTAKYFDTDHTELQIGPRDVLNNLEKIVWHLDEPNFTPTAAAIFLLSKLAKERVAVVLGGDGGDELFGGYPRYYFSRIISYFQSMPGILQQLVKHGFNAAGKSDLLTKLSLSKNEERIVAFLVQKHNLLTKVLNKDVYRPNAARQHINEKYFQEEMNSMTDFEKQFMNIDRQSWLVDESLLRTDKMTMAHGLEERVPILDYRLVELANKIPTFWKFHVWNHRPSTFQGKMIWKEAIRDFLPEHILREKKRGWFTPMAKWLRGELREYVSEILLPQNLQSEFFNAAEVEQVWQNHLNSKQYNLNVIWAIVMWKLWYNRFIESKI